MMLLESEVAAKSFVAAIGVDRATKLLELVCNRITRRAVKGSTPGQPLTTDYVRIAPWECELKFKLQMGLSLLDDYNTPSAAKQRILARIAERKAKSLQRR